MAKMSHETWGLKQLRGEALARAVMERKWFAQEDDLIGGWCVMPVNEHPSLGCFPVAGFTSEEFAKHIAYLHNTFLEEC